MPCTYDESPQEVAQRRQQYIDDHYVKPLDKLTAENDHLRELLLDIYDKHPEVTLSLTDLKKIKTDQLKHRKEDLTRLQKTFTKNKDATRLGKVMLADPKKPLKEQLGFEPDEF